MTEEEARAAIVNEAITFIGTKYHHHGRVKGAGVDCLTFITCVAENIGLVPHIELPHYSAQYGANRNEETYLGGLQKYCHEVEIPKPGDIVIFKFGRVYAHAAIVLGWPRIIHAHAQCGVVLEDANAAWLAYLGKEPRPRKFFSYWKPDEPTERPEANDSGPTEA